MKNTKHFSAFLVALAVLTALPGKAQVAPAPAVYASGLLGPRGLKFGPDGMLYVAEAGTGGSTASASLSCTQVPGPVGPYTGGPSARISKIDGNGNRTTVATGLPSGQSSDPTGDTMGAAAIAFLDGTLYAVTAGGGCSHGNPSEPNGIIQINQQTGNWRYVANLSQFVQSHPAAYTDASDFEPDGVFYSLIAWRGKLYTVEPNHGQIFSVTPDGHTEEIIDVSHSEGHIVPTSLAAKNGNLYVGNLGQFPIFPQLQRVLTLSEDFLFSDNTLGLSIDPLYKAFRIASSRAGFTTIVGLDFGPDGLLYVLELSPAAGYPAAASGKVVRLRRDGEIEDVVTGLTLPTGMTFGPDKALYVSNLGAVPGPAGQILKIDVPLLY
jgi:hypothetical protein